MLTTKVRQYSAQSKGGLCCRLSVDALTPLGGFTSAHSRLVLRTLRIFHQLHIFDNLKALLLLSTRGPSILPC